MLRVPLVSSATRSSASSSSSTRSATRQGAKLLTPERRRRAGHPVRRAQRGAARRRSRRRPAISLENAILYDEIRRLFEGFVNAQRRGDRARDPTTRGHSRRVADLTVGLAEVVERSRAARSPALHFTGDDLRELEYAASSTTSARSACARRCSSRPRSSTSDELEIIRARFDFVRVDRGRRRSRASCGVLQRRAEAAARASPRSTASSRRAGRARRPSWRSSCAPTSRRCWPRASSRSIEATSRARRYVDPRGDVQPLLDARRGRPRSS